VAVSGSNCTGSMLSVAGEAPTLFPAAEDGFVPSNGFATFASGDELFSSLPTTELGTTDPGVACERSIVSAASKHSIQIPLSEWTVRGLRQRRQELGEPTYYPGFRGATIEKNHIAS
jgi:hypothetical protein